MNWTPGRAVRSGTTLASSGALIVSLAVACTTHAPPPCVCPVARTDESPHASPASDEPARGKTPFLTDVAASAPTVAAPEDNRTPLTAELGLDHYQVYRDERGNAFLVSFEGLNNGMAKPTESLFFRTRQTFHAQSVQTWKGQEGNWSITFLDSHLGTSETASLRFAQQQTTVVCGAGAPHPLSVVVGEERTRLLEGAGFSKPRWRPVALGRETDTQYLYIDVASEPVRYRIFVGDKGAMRLTGSFLFDEMFWGDDAVEFVWHGGKLHLRRQAIAGAETYVMSWAGSGHAVDFVPMSPWQNQRLIFGEFGLYRGEPTPCSERAASAGVTAAEAR